MSAFVRRRTGSLAFAIFLVFATLSSIRAASGIWSYSSAMPAMQWAPAMGVIDSKLYLAGGSYSNTLTVYDPASDSWATKASMTYGRYAPAGGAINGKLYVVAGHDGGGTPHPNLEIYDPVTDSWSTGASIPNSYSYTASAVNGGKLYVIGGATGSCSSLDYVQIYDPVTDSWTSGAPMPTPRFGMGAAVIGGKIYVIGGGVNPCTDAEPVNVNEVYDPASDSWSTQAPMPTPREFPATGLIDGALYAAGGYFSGTSLSVNEVYNPSLNTWAASTPAPATLAPQNVSGSVINRTIYAVSTLTSETRMFAFTPNLAVYTATILEPINANGSSVFNAKRGSVPIKFALAVNGESTCQLPAATIALTRTAGATLGPINQSDYIMPSDSGSDFRVSSCQYVYNLASGSLGAGTYLVEIKVASATIGTATFALR